MSEKLSGIERALIHAGSNQRLIQLLLRKADLQISERAVSYWRKVGYVPTVYVLAVAKVTGVPIEDLVRKRPRIRRPNGHAGTNGSAADQR